MTTDTMPAKRQMSIERLLQWAYQQELCNLSAGDGEGETSQQHPMWKMRVDGSGGGWDVNAVSRIVAPDALLVRETVLRMDKPVWADGVDFPSIAYASWRVSFAERPFIDAAIENAQTLVVRHARIGDRPMADDVPSPHRRLLPSGRPEICRVVMVEEKLASGDKAEFPREIMSFEQRVWRKRAGVYETGSYCLLDYWPTEEHLLRDRADYVVWRATLSWLAQEIGDRLERIAVSAEMPPEIGWNAN